ncbi:MAG: hypothetical protein KAU01_03945 [Candidatus Cloacimonetes bacterium]|nr:hypothetical protein [Candidatus Cloacimonadota bacterium]
MRVDELTQKQIDLYVANKEDFWNSFHKILLAPYAFWRENKNKSLQELVNTCWNSSFIVKAIDNLAQYPVLKGEGLVVAISNGSLLTNYRIIVCYSGGSLINIPMYNLLHYDIQTAASDTRQDLLIKYLLKGEEQILRIDSWIPDEIVRAVRDAHEYDELNEEQKSIIENSLYDLERKKLNLSIPKIGMLPKSDKKGCFVATATYSNYDHPDVIELRNFRDNFLGKKKFGKKMIKIYYQYSPCLAKIIRKHKFLRHLSRIFLITPLLFFF